MRGASGSEILKNTRPGRLAALLLFLLLTGFPALTGLGQDQAVTAGTAAAPVVSRIIVEIMEGTGDDPKLASMARAMIFLEEGVPFSDDRFQKSLLALRESGMFRAINVPDPDWSSPEITLRFELTPFLRTRAVKVEGAFPILEREVHRAIGLYPGGSFAPDKIPEQEEAVRKLFREQGYADPGVAITFEPVPGNEAYVDLKIKVEKGRYFQIQEFTLEGNRAFSDFRLKLRTDTWKKSLFFGEIQRFVQRNLDRDVAGLLQFYRSRGYADATIDPRVELDPDKASARIRLKIEEGPHYEITFHGNREYSSWWTLRKDLDLKNGNRNDAGLRKSLHNIRERYRSDGYLESRVTTRDETEPGEEGKKREISILIDEGPQSVIGEITVEGNEAFSAKRIRKQMLTETPGIFANGAYDPQRLKEDVGAVKLLYLKDGYLNTGVDSQISWEGRQPETTPGDPGTEQAEQATSSTESPEASPEGREMGKRTGRLNLEIEEGVRTRVATLSIAGNTAVTREEVEKGISLKVGEPFRAYLLESDENAITRIIAEKGYPYVTVQGTYALSQDGTEADVAFLVDEGKYVKLGEVHFIGNFKTSEKVLRNELEIEPGEPFSAVKILESQRNLQNMEAVNSVQYRLPGLQARTGVVNYFIEVEEKRPLWMELSFGHDTERHLFGALRGGNRNLFGRNNDLRGRLELSQIGYRLDGAVTEPRFLQSRISSTTTLFAEKREAFNLDFGTRSQGISQVFERRLLNRRMNLGLTLGLERREQYLRNDGEIPAGDEDLYTPRSVFITTPSIVYNSTNSYTRPRKGVYASLFVDLSRGWQGAMDSFIKYRLEARYYRTPSERLTLALRGKYGFIYPYGTDSIIPDDQLFYLGGTSSVRGYDENLLRFDAEGTAVGGRESLLGNIEARYDLGMNFETAAFYDIGSVRKLAGAGGSTDFRSSAGLGLRYITPIGAVGLLYGWKLDRLDGENPGSIHFSIGYIF